ncbi:hypothetical protein [Alkalibacillus haloalkaliphilus]|uniref:hypothetical protein n=1 Tax=Alkalibacillus haloalkaliphilus TaxID=94136 RepID=UPI0029363766|nr:hypothetical protein [Alkalibacillus haloalkaliphilus]MDV2582915.1 hypothetical protein [Alkalibacillus haloalkaliphilus]
MHEKGLNGGQELLCINTEKVYDWIINEATFDLNVVDEDLPNDLDCDDIDLDDVTCTVEPAEEDPIEIINREDRTFVIDGTEITLQVVTIRKNFVVTINLPTDNGDEEVDLEFSRSEQVVLCAPEGTEIEVTYTELDCFVVSFDCEPGDTELDDTFDAVISVRLCQSIQAVFPVTLELVADFCEPRDQLPVQPCPIPTRPEQCPVLFPTANNDHHGKY